MKYLVRIGILMANTAICAWADSLNFKKVEIPTGSDAMAPNLSLMGDHFALSWINRNEGEKSRFFFTEWNGSSFEIQNLIAASEKMFSNWADIPSIVEAANGDLYAHWLERISSKQYAYGIRITISSDRGKTWSPMGWLHDDESETEHGFVSLIPDGANVRAFWLDGRKMTKPSGKMALHTAILEGNEIKEERTLDQNVCTCCPTSAIQLTDGPMVVYRDRSAEEIRDFSFVTDLEQGWSAPEKIAEDNWLMPGCPVNGASIASSGDLVAISRFTVIQGKPQVILQIYKQEQSDVRKDLVLDKNAPIGRCSTVCTKDAIYTIWIGKEKKQTVLRMAEVSPNGNVRRQEILCTIDASFSSGMPRSILSGDHVWVSWTDSNRIHLGRFKVNQ
ncbi:hypothetical protein OAH23_11265 [Verrucomicrobia bacterium]|nr:hypothetical protein [Verrucomicrobiota bacterium]